MYAAKEVRSLGMTNAVGSTRTLGFPSSTAGFSAASNPHERTHHSTLFAVWLRKLLTRE